MPFVTTCPHCQAAFRAPDHAKGQTVPCTRCRKSFLCRPAEAAREPERSSLLPAVLGGVVVAVLIGAAGLAFVWLQTRPRSNPSAVASAGSSETKPAVTEARIPEPEVPIEAPKQVPPAELGPPPTEVTEAKKVEDRPTEVKPDAPKKELAMEEPPTSEPPKTEVKPEPPKKELAKVEPKTEVKPEPPKKELTKVEPKPPLGKLPLGKLPPKTKEAPVKVDPKVESQVKTSLEWLKKQQRKDGQWISGLGSLTANSVTTAFACLSMMASGDPAHDEAIHKGARFIISNLFQDKYQDENFPKHSAQPNWKVGICGLFVCEYYAWRKAREPDFDTTELDGVLDRIVEDIFKRMETSGGWGHLAGVKDLEGYDELHAVGQWMLAAAGACERLGRKVPADKVKLALKYVENCCAPGTGAVGYSTRPNQIGALLVNVPGVLCPGRIGGALFGFALLKQQKHPLYPRMVIAYNMGIVHSAKGHGSLCLVMLASGMGARQLSDQTWKDFQSKFFPFVMAAAEPDGTFKGLIPKDNVGADEIMKANYTTAIYTLILQLDSGRLRFVGQRHLDTR